MKSSQIRQSFLDFFKSKQHTIVLFATLLPATVWAAQTNIIGPAGSGRFGSTVTVLPNGNIVVTDPAYSEGAANIGAVYLYSGTDLSLISTLKGSSANDQIGSLGITVLSNGNYVVVSENWDNPSPLRANAGAVTWCNSATGLAGVVSAANSLIGISSNNYVGRGNLGNGVTALANGNYVVTSVVWDDPATLTDVGAVTWGNGATGSTGTVDASNSLIGSSTTDRIGNEGVIALANGNYVVRSALWDNPAPVIADVGAATWGNGTTGTVGVVGAGNSLIGSTASDNIGFGAVTALPNGNYVVCSHNWDNTAPAIVNAGAATFCSGTTGRTGLVSSANSLVGATASDRIGISGAKALANGNYVVISPNWSKPAPAVANAGAVTLCDGTTGLTGVVSAANSLTGSTANDRVGSGGTPIAALANGNFVVVSFSWDNPAPLIQDVGAVTWCSGTTGRAGEVVSATNSLIGSTASDGLGYVVALSNGNYVAYSPLWNNPSPAKTDVGVAAWCSGVTGRTGILSAANALVGSTAGDKLTDGGGGVTALANGNYVTVCGSWDNPATGSNNVGAATFCDGNTGRTGEISPNNSLVGSAVGASVGGAGVTALKSGHYVVNSPNWDNGLPSSVGAVTWCDGSTGRTGEVSSANSLLGTVTDDQVGSPAVFPFDDGTYVVVSTEWNNGGIVDAGAATLGDGASGIAGTINSTNSVVGTVKDDIKFTGSLYGYDTTRSRLAVGRSAQNIVTFFTPPGLAPKLAIARAAAGNAMISWTPDTPEFILQERLNLSSGAWSNSLSGATNPITVPATLPTKFYRLLKP